MRYAEKYVIKIILALAMMIPSFAFADSVDCMAKAIYFESRGGSDNDQLAVGHTVQNRVKSKSFPNSTCSVVNQKSQFAPHIRNGSRINEQTAWQKAKTMARKVLNGNSKDFTGGATYFHTPAVNPRWANKFKIVHRNRQHIFYKP